MRAQLENVRSQMINVTQNYKKLSQAERDKDEKMPLEKAFD